MQDSPWYFVIVMAVLWHIDSAYNGNGNNKIRYSALLVVVMVSYFMFAPDHFELDLIYWK